MAPESAQAQGEHSRRFAAEIRVAIGDLRRLQSETLTPKHVKGLQDRITGALAGLEIMLRLADQEIRRSVQSSQPVRIDIKIESNGNLAQVQAQLEELAAAYPLLFPAIRFESAAPQLEPFESLHKQHCAACHDVPVTDTERPAHNLFESAMSMSAEEFFARMLVGVRGDSVTGIDNPLGDDDIMGLISFYKFE